MNTFIKQTVLICSILSCALTPCALQAMTISTKKEQPVLYKTGTITQLQEINSTIEHQRETNRNKLDTIETKHKGFLYSRTSFTTSLALFFTPWLLPVAQKMIAPTGTNHWSLLGAGIVSLCGVGLFALHTSTRCSLNSQKIKTTISYQENISTLIQNLDDIIGTETDQKNKKFNKTWLRDAPRTNQNLEETYNNIMALREQLKKITSFNMIEFRDVRDSLCAFINRNATTYNAQYTKQNENNNL